MRVTVDIDDALLLDTMSLTGEKNKSPAIAKAVQEYVRRARAKEFGTMIRENAFDYSETGPSDEELLNPIPPLNTITPKNK